jgi:Fur family ferric uptake transcriptional regulator
MEATRILSDRKLSITAGRMRILSVLLESSVALSEKEIRSRLQGDCDRATVYRTLKTFTEKDIVHPVITENLTTKYVIKKAPENHLHFKCTACDKVYCMTTVKLSSYSLPEGFVQTDTNFLVTGICKACNRQ